MAIPTYTCPRCGLELMPRNAAALARLRAAAACQGCRAARTLASHPERYRLLVAFWKTHRFPQSPSWLEPVHASGDGTDAGTVSSLPGSGRSDTWFSPDPE